MGNFRLCGVFFFAGNGELVNLRAVIRRTNRMREVALEVFKSLKGPMAMCCLRTSYDVKNSGN